MARAMTFTRFGILVLTTVLFSGGLGLADVEFDRLNGADLGMGVGARAIGMAGAFTAVADDATAFYWNPAGLTQVKENQFFAATDIPADFSTAAVIFKPRKGWSQRHGFTFGLALVDQLNFKGDSGSGTWEGYPSHLLDLAMIDVDPTFSGEISTRTFDARLSMAIKVPQVPKLSIGLNLAQIW